MNTYEIVAVIRPDLDEEGLGTVIERIHQRIGEHGGAVQSTDRWGKRKIAFPIKKYRDGYYVLSVFTLDSGRVAGLRQTFGLHEDLLRFTIAAHHASPAAVGTQTAPAAGAPAAASSASAATPSAPASAPHPAEGTPSTAPSEGSHV